jgi:molybdopterin/thiamine biosynthesis adenylyltransferase
LTSEFAQHPELARYSRQMLLAPIGVEGQRRLRQASVTLVGSGALGSVLADILVRAGIGALRIIDRDVVELDNLQRQTLFDEYDVAQNLPKAEAAARKLRRINSAVEVEGLVADVNPANAVGLCADADLLLDGTDNLETRYLLNDLAVQQDLPWVYAACLGTEGLVLPIVPHQGPCLRCVWPDPPPPGTMPTCDTAGILAATANVVGSLAATEAMKLLLGKRGRESLPEKTPDPFFLLVVEVWAGRVRAVQVQAAGDGDGCPCCQQGRYDFLAGTWASGTAALCGGDAVHVRPPAGTAVNLKSLAARLPAQVHPRVNEFLLRFEVESLRIALFSDGRAIIQGTSDPAVARGVYAKYVGI